MKTPARSASRWRRRGTGPGRRCPVAAWWCAALDAVGRPGRRRPRSPTAHRPPGPARGTASWLRDHAAPQMPAQRQRLQRGDARALPVDGVEAAHRVAHHQQPVREPRQPPSGAARWPGTGSRRGRPAPHVPDRLMDVGEPQRPGEGQEAVGVGGWVVAQHAGQSHHPPATLHQQQRAARGWVGWGRPAPRGRRRASGGSR